MNDASETPKPIIDIRFGQVGLVHVRLHTTEPGTLIDELSGRIAAAPQFFRRTAICLDLSVLEEAPQATELRAVIDAVRRVGMLAVGLVGDAASLKDLSSAVDLPILASYRAPPRQTSNTQPVVAAVTAGAADTVAGAVAGDTVTPTAASASASANAKSAASAKSADGVSAEMAVPALMQTQPVRSGQRVYARHRDLIVTATVAAGAEVMADGCLHIYGALRGRAMAGARGDLSARVFCQEFHAELVSIAGVFRIFETVPADLAGKPVQVWLEGEALHCARIGT